MRIPNPMLWIGMAMSDQVLNASWDIKVAFPLAIASEVSGIKGNLFHIPGHTETRIFSGLTPPAF